VLLPIVPQVAVHVALALAVNCSVPFTVTDGLVGEMVNAVVEPVPESETFCGLFVAESVKLSVADRAPDAVGLKMTDAVQFAPAGRLVPQDLAAMLKSPALVPDSATLLIVIEELNPFDRVAVCDAVLEPTEVLPNVRLEGVAVTVPDEILFPVRATVCGLLLAESLKFSVADRAPVPAGAKTMLTVQVAEAARDAPHVLLEIAKSAGLEPEKDRLLIVRVEVPVFLSVIAFGAPLFPIATETQFKEVGLTDALPEPVAAPVPLRATVWGLLVAESVKLRVAERAPDAVGLNTTEAVQEPAAARLAPQVLIAMLKSPAFAPDIATLLMVIAELSPFESVADFEALVEPTFVLPNTRLVGLADTLPLAEVPVPVKVIFWGLPLPESLKFNVADRAPVVVGAKTIFAVQLEDAASEAPQVLL
jgi:hypothetical protein